MTRRFASIIVYTFAILSCGYAQADLIADDVLAKAEMSLETGDHAGAEALFESLLMDHELTDRHRARVLGGLGLARAAGGEAVGAESALNESIVIASKSLAKDIAAKSQFNLALVNLSNLGRDATPTEWFDITRGATSTREVFWKDETDSKKTVESAIEQLVVAANTAIESEDRALAIRAWATAAKYQASTSSDAAIESLLRAYSTLPQELTNRDVLQSALLLGESAITMVPIIESSAKDSVQQIAFDSLERSLRGARQISDNRLESYALGLLGRMYGLDGKFRDAIALTERAIVLAEQSNAREIQFVWNGQLAGYFERISRTDSALVAYQRAAANIQSVRSELAKSVSGAGQISSRELIEPILLSYADLLLQSGSPAQIVEARDVVEQLKTIEFERFFEETCVAASSGRETDLLAVDPNAMVIYPVIFNDRLELLISFGDEIERVTVNVSRSELEFRSKSARNMLRFDDGTRGPLEDLGLLHSWLVAPAIELIAREPSIQLDTIVFAPDGVLRGLPISALYDNTTERFLIEDYAIAYTIGLTLVDPQPFERVPRLGVHAGIGSALVLPGASVDNQAVSFSELNAVGGELDQIQTLIPGPTLFNEQFTKEAFSRVLYDNRYTVAHLATHATFGRTASDSYLLAHSGQEGRGSKITLDELEAYTSQARIRGEPIELLTLSACETGVGDPDAENENAVLGLAGVAFKAGARSVLASLWQVYDDSTAKLMTQFYTDLVVSSQDQETAVSKAEALRRAQLSLLRDASGEFDHPSHWAAFILFGNWL